VSLSEGNTRSLISCENGVLAYGSHAQWYGSIKCTKSNSHILHTYVLIKTENISIMPSFSQSVPLQFPHFGDESFQAITCAGTNKQKPSTLNKPNTVTLSTINGHKKTKRHKKHLVYKSRFNNFLGNPKPQKLQKSSVLVIFHTKSETYRPNVYTM